MYGNFGGGRRGPPRTSFAPVKVGEELDVTIEAVGEKGDGVAKVKGFVLFIPNVQEGQNVKVKVTKVLRKVGFAEVIGEGSGSSEEAPAMEPEPVPEDSEDFGEEEPKEDEPEDESEEEPAEEVGDVVPEPPKDEDDDLDEELPGPEDEVPEEDDENKE